MNFCLIKTRKFYDKYYKETNGYYPFFKNCPIKYHDFYLQKRYYDMIGSYVDLENPKTFNEKIRWLLFNEQLDLHTKLTDKIAVKSWWNEKLGYDYYSHIYGKWEKYKDIDFDSLPDKFALKANHGWRMNLFIIDKEKFLKNHYKESEKEVSKWLKTNYYYSALEPQYKNIKPMVFAEELREVIRNYYRDDIMIHCFNSKPVFIETRSFKHKYTLMHDTNWNLIPFTLIKRYIRTDIEMERPKNLDDILNCAELLSKDFSYVRVDFANLDNKIILSEMTFSPSSAMLPIFPRYYDEKLGEMLILPSKETISK